MIKRKSVQTGSLHSLFILFISSAIMMNACKKSGETNIPQALEEVSEFYAKNVTTAKSNPFSSLLPDWENVYTHDEGGQVIYEIKLSNPEKIIDLEDKAGQNELDKYRDKNNIRLIIFKNKQNGILETGCYMSVTDDGGNPSAIHYKQFSDLSGRVAYFSLSGQFANAWLYADGKIAKRLSASTKESYLSSLQHLDLIEKSGSGVNSKGEKLMNRPAVICYTTPIFIYGQSCVGVDGYLQCTTYLASVVYTEICEGGGSDDDGGYVPPHGGGVTDPYIDCNGDRYGTAIRSVECGCIGGNTGIAACPPVIEVKEDSLQKHYPCMVKEILNKLLINSTYGKLLQPFQSVRLPNGSTINTQGLPNLTFDYSSQSYGGTSTNYSMGQTSSAGGYSSKIEFNSLAMGNASQLFLQMAAIHEVAHAYSRFYIKAGTYGVPIDTTRYSTWAMNIVNFESASKSELQNGNFSDHSLFLENYVDNFVKVLKEVNGSSYTDKQYQMTALFGLNNAGEVPANAVVNGINIYNIYKDVLNKSYDKLMTKFGITPAERDAFYLANLKNVPIEKKLPTDCPN